MKWLLIAAMVLCGGEASAQMARVPVPTQPLTRAFTPLHLYFVTVGGHDTCNGLGPSTGTSNPCAWLTLNHSGIVCGDVVLLGPGTYTTGFKFNEWGTVGGCPSSIGGIDGQGGINFAIFLCAGPDLMSCQINTPSLDPIRPSKGHWAIEGIWASQGPGPTHPGSSEQTGCFTGDNQGSVGGPEVYLAFINDIASVCNLSGFTVGGGGCNPNIDGCSFDNIAVIGTVSFNGANSLTGGNGFFCGSGISLFPGTPFNTPGTHIYVSQYFGAYNTNATGTGAGNECDAAFQAGTHPHTDGEGFIFDTYASGYAIDGSWNKPAVLIDSAIWHSGNACVESFPQGNGTTDEKGQYYVTNVTCYSNSMDPRAGCAGEFHANGIYPTGTALYQVKNNIFFATQTSCGGAGVIDVDGAMTLWGATAHVVVLDAAKIDVSNNWIWQSHAPTSTVVGPPNTWVVDNLPSSGQAVCSPPFSPPCFNAPWHFGTNTYGDPGLTSPTTLFSTSPDCTGYDNVVTCMNVAFGVYAKIKPTIAPTSMGYQPPGPCLTDTTSVRYQQFPAGLKGIVHLKALDGFVAGSRIQQRSGLTTKPCAL